MKDSWFKVISIALAVALVFSIITSNIVTITAISSLRKAKVAAGTAVPVGQGSNEGKNDGNNTAQPDNSGTGDTNETTAADTTPSGSGGNGSGGSGSGGGTTAQQKQGMSKAEVLNIYKNAINKVKNNAAAGYTKKEWQSLPELDIGTLGKILNPFIDRFMTQEADAKEEVSAKGSDDAKRRFPACTLTDLSKIATATCTESGGNYNIKIVMIDEKNPKESNNFLGQITNSVLYEEGIREEVDGLVLLGSPLVEKGYTFDITYNAFTITAKITKDGKFISLEHFANVPIKADAKVAKIYNLNGTARLENNCKYYDFKY
jgi:hypothetical protein